MTRQSQRLVLAAARPRRLELLRQIGLVPDKVVGADGRSNEDSPFPKGSPMEQFFRRVGMPDGMPGQGAPRGRNFVSGQGSGFLISADGYAVTNNHVVEKASTVEVAFDDGKT